MARIKLVYVGGGSTRAGGTMASFLHNGADFDGSEVVLVDLDPDRLALIEKLARRMAAAAVLVAAPIVVVYIVLQRHFIRGMLAGAIKE